MSVKMDKLNQYSKTNIMKKIMFQISLITLFTIIEVNLSMAVDHYNWQKANAKIEVIKMEVMNLSTNGTLFGLLLKQNNKKIGDVTESDKRTVLTFNIEYEAPVQLKNEKKPSNRTITQNGLYRTLHPRFQEFLKNKGILKGPIEIGILYERSDPIFISFPLGEEVFSAPALIADTIDAGWQAK
jgi:hypothetical protein